MDDYAAAKEDFATRSGLVSEKRLFSSSQLTEMYRCMADTIDSGYELTDEQTKLIENTQKGAYLQLTGCEYAPFCVFAEKGK